MKKSVPVKSPSLQRRSVRQSRSFASREYHSCGRFNFLQQRKEQNVLNLLLGFKNLDTKHKQMASRGWKDCSS